MTIKSTPLKDCFIVEPKLFQDHRGYFFESFNHQLFEDLIQQKIDFIQDNQSLSKKGVVRGLHAQGGLKAQSKLVRVLKGEVLDVVVDIRKDSETFGKHFSVVISEKNHKQLFIPKGFLHGFSVLSNEAIVCYKCDNYYDKNSEIGALYNSEFLSIDWKISAKEAILSEKDLQLPSFEKAFFKS